MTVSAHDYSQRQMMVLDVMLNDVEDLFSIMLHLHGWRRNWPGNLTEAEIGVALRMLFEKGWVRAFEPRRNQDNQEVLSDADVARMSEDAFRDYWFEPTQSWSRCVARVGATDGTRPVISLSLSVRPKLLAIGS